METHHLLWAKSLSFGFKKLGSLEPDSQIKLDFLQESQDGDNQNVMSSDFEADEQSEDALVKNSNSITNQMMSPYIQLSFHATQNQTSKDGLKLVKIFTGDVISLRDLVSATRGHFISGIPLNWFIDFAKNLVDAINCFYEFETVHNDIRVENICFNKKENRFKLAPSHKSLQGWPETPNALDRDKLGFLLVLFEVTEVIPFDKFSPGNLVYYFKDLAKKTSQAFVDVLQSAKLAEQTEFYRVMRIYESLQQSQEEEITDREPPIHEKLHMGELGFIPFLEMRFRGYSDDYSLRLMKKSLTQAKESLGFEDPDGFKEKRNILKYPAPEEINELSATLRFIKGDLNSIIGEFGRFDRMLESLIFDEFTQKKEMFFEYPNSKKLNERYKKFQHRNYSDLQKEIEKIRLLVKECFSIEQTLISVESIYFLFHEAKCGKYPNPEEMQKLSSTAKRLYAYLQVIDEIWRELKFDIEQKIKERKEVEDTEILEILRSEGGEEKEILIPGLIKIQNLNEIQEEDLSPAISSYYHDFVDLSKIVKQSSNTKTLNEKMDYYASGCVLNYHFWCLKNLKTNQDLLNIFAQGNHIIDKYGSSLEPHRLYRIHRIIPDKEALIKSQEIMASIQAEQNSNKLLFNILDKLASDFDSQVIFTERESSQEQDSLHVLGTGSLSEKFLKVTLPDLSEKDFQKMAEEPAFAGKIYQQFKEVVKKSEIFGSDHDQNVDIVAIECNPLPTAVIPIGSNIVQSINQAALGKDVIIEQIPIIKYLSINTNHFDKKGNMEWGENHIDSEPRGGLDYFFPKGWKGYGLKVLGKYPPDDKWLTKWDHNGWAVGYHGVANKKDSNPGTTIQKILKSELRAGDRQFYEDDKDVSPFAPWIFGRTVGKGVYFGKKIEISEYGYSNVVTLKDGIQFKVLLQCRLNPKEVRIPKSKTDYYVVPEGHIRPYRILVKEVKQKQSGKKEIP